MYKFTNGIVVYDEGTRDNYIKAGMTLIKENEDSESKNATEGTSEEIKFARPEGFGKAGARNKALSDDKFSSKVNKKVGK